MNDPLMATLSLELPETDGAFLVLFINVKAICTRLLELSFMVHDGPMVQTLGILANIFWNIELRLD